jgi:thiol-disulfide isomerase/thioredoxin
VLLQEERLLLVAFWTAGCEPCRELRASLGGLDGEIAEVVAVNADDEPEAVLEHRVSDFPTLLFYKRGQELHRLKGGALPASTLELLGPG